MKRIFIAIALLTLSLSSTFAASYKIDAAKSSVRWEGSKLTGTHWGFIDIKSGALNEKSGKWTGEFIIDMNTIKDMDLEDKSYNEKLVGHLKSDDFFSVEKYPTAKLKITSIKAKKQKSGTHTVSGSLTIKGKTRKINFPATLSFNGNEMTANANIIIDRSKWDVRYGSKSFFKSIGDKAIDNDIKFEVKLTGIKEDVNS